MKMNKKTKEIMQRVWNDIFDNEACTCRDFEDYWQWKVGEQDHINSNIHKMLYLQERNKLTEILDSLDDIRMHLKEDGLYALRVLYDYVDELKKEDPDIIVKES